jgi:small conductance mechanosensitive channel
MNFLLAELQKILYKLERILYKNFRIDSDAVVELLLVGLATFLFSKFFTYLFKRLSAQAEGDLARKELYDFLSDAVSFFFLSIFILTVANDVPIIAKKYMTGLEIILIAMFIHKIVRFYIDKKLDKLQDNDDKTKLAFLQNTLKLLVFMVAGFAVILSIPQFREFALTLFASAGIFAAFIGLASQKAFANLVSGIFIVIFKPFRVGDVIEVDGHLGEVKDITLRHTRILNYENRSVIIPNSSIDSSVIKNSSFPENKVCRYFEVVITYSSDIDTALKILEEEVSKHRLYLDYRSYDDIQKENPKVRLRTLRLTDDGVMLRANLWARNFDDVFDMHTELNKTVKERFQKEGIEIAYPHRVVIMKQE